ALDNIYNSVIAKDYNSNIRGFSQKNYLDFMYKLRIPVIKHQNIENKHIFYDLLAVDFIKIINRNGIEYVVLAPYGQQYLRVTRKNRKYKASSFVYYIF
ncbi:MAG: hypothetical protein N2170_10075, partial [Bacteroidia bacterium]|nr:hypothetical protein [Bacteroidia bacterium]